MKKVSSAAARASRKISEQKLTVGLDLGDRSSWYCMLDESGAILLEKRLSTTPKAVREIFGGMPRSRIALETGTHSPWISRLLSALGHEVDRGAGAQRAADWREPQEGRSLGRADIGSAGENRSRVAMSSETPQYESTGGSEHGPGTSGPGASAHGAGEHRTRTGEELRRTLAQLQRAQHEPGQSRGTEPGVASRTAAVAGGAGVAERTHRRVQRAARETGARELSADGVAEAGEGSGHVDRADVR